MKNLHIKCDTATDTWSFFRLFQQLLKNQKLFILRLVWSQKMIPDYASSGTEMENLCHLGHVIRPYLISVLSPWILLTSMLKMLANTSVRLLMTMEKLPREL